MPALDWQRTHQSSPLQTAPVVLSHPPTQYAAQRSSDPGPENKLAHRGATLWVSELVVTGSPL